MPQLPAMGMPASSTLMPTSMRSIGRGRMTSSISSGMTTMLSRQMRYRRGLVIAARRSLCATDAPMIIIASGVFMEPMEASVVSMASGRCQPVTPKVRPISAATMQALTMFFRLNVAPLVISSTP